MRIGETYEVPCVRGKNGSYYPVVGPAHIDGSELCQRTPTVEHWHVDYRFTEREDKQFGLITDPQEPQMRSMVCVRERSDNGILLWAMIRLGRAYQNSRINVSDPICPHQKQRIVNEDGQCPGHGFCWNMETGRPRYLYPYYVRFKGREERQLVDDREIIKIKVAENVTCPAIVELIDSNNSIIGEYLFPGTGPFYEGDIFTIKTDCLKEN